MAELLTVARPYAKAAFQFADESGALTDWSQMLGFAAAIAEDEAVRTLLHNPKVTADQKSQVMSDICGDKINSAMKNFIALLAQNRRLAVLPEIVALFEELKSQKEHSVDVELVSAFPLTDEQTNKLAASLKQKLGREINVSSSTDQALLGGVIIRAGDMVIDGSVRGKLAKLADKLNS